MSIFTPETSALLLSLPNIKTCTQEVGREGSSVRPKIARQATKMYASLCLGQVLYCFCFPAHLK